MIHPPRSEGKLRYPYVTHITPPTKLTALIGADRVRVGRGVRFPGVMP